MKRPDGNLWLRAAPIGALILLLALASCAAPRQLAGIGDPLPLVDANGNAVVR